MDKDYRTQSSQDKPNPSHVPPAGIKAEDERSTFQIVGGDSLNCLGLAPRYKLRNIPGNNWPFPPLAIDHVSYTYLDEEALAEIEELAEMYEATFRSESVYVDGNRYMHYSLSHNLFIF